MKMYTATIDERADNPIIRDEDNNNLVMSREGESEDLFVDEDSMNSNNNLPKLLQTPINQLSKISTNA